MVDFDIPPKENRSMQWLLSIIGLIIVSLLAAIFAKVIIGLIIFLLGAIAGIGAAVVGNNPLGKE